MNCWMTDLHTHILPAFDDGARDMETALQMLREARAGGVERLALTPHFYPMRENSKSFIKRRQEAFEALLSHWDADTMPRLKLGAEVRYTAELAQMDLRPLTLGDSDYMLLELPMDFLPPHVEQVVQSMVNRGITPVLAHVERCLYFRNAPDRLLQLVHLGALAQVSAKRMTDRKDRKFAQSCLKSGLAHLIASDAHGFQGESPCLKHLIADVQSEVKERAEEFAWAIWNNECPPAFSISPVKKGVFGYR